LESNGFTSQRNEVDGNRFLVGHILWLRGLKQATVQVVNWAKGSRTKQRAAGIGLGTTRKKGGSFGALFCENEAGARARGKRTKVTPA